MDRLVKGAWDEPEIPDALYHTDVHGKSMWRKAMTLRLAEEVRSELRALP